jgi:hypothetical protein
MGIVDLFYEEFILERKEEALRKGLSEGSIIRVNTQSDSLWSIKKVLCALLMIQGLITRRRDLNEVCNPSPLLTGEVRGEATTGAVSFSPSWGS